MRDVIKDVRTLYKENLEKGMTPKDAAKAAQELTGRSAVTGEMIKQRGPIHKTKRKWIYGEVSL